MPTPSDSNSADARLIYAASETNADLLYATGFFAPDPFIFLIHRGKKIMVMGDLEFDRARLQARVDKVLLLAEWEHRFEAQWRKKGAPAQLLNFLLRTHGIHSVQVPYDFPAGLAAELRRLNLRIEVKASPFFLEREIKRPEEIRAIKKALGAAEAAMESAFQMLRESSVGSGKVLRWQGTKLTAEMVRREISQVLLQKDCAAAHTIVACGPPACDPHLEGSGPLKANQPIIIDIFPRSLATGYWGDITRTVVKGPAGEPLRELFETVQQGQKKALKMVKPGITGVEIHQAVLAFFTRKGYSTGKSRGHMEGFFHGTGHGVGLEIHELPRVGTKGVAPLRAGQVLTIEPGLYYPSLGGVRLEDLVVVTESGCRNLTRLPKVLEIE